MIKSRDHDNQIIFQVIEAEIWMISEDELWKYDYQKYELND